MKQAFTYHRWHPVFLQEDLLRTGSTFSYLPPSNFSTEALVKLLKFGTYARARQLRTGESILDVIGSEAKRYPYTQKTSLKVGGLAKNKLGWT